jgi:probable F420-dependent oxidoreductase
MPTRPRTTVTVIPPGTLAYGMQLPIQAQSTAFVEEWEPTAGAAELAAVARACDESGFLYVAVCDHIAIPKALAPKMGTAWFDTIATLGWLAGITTDTLLLSHVYVPAYRHPLATAKAFATLDALSGGRAILGVGAGHVEAEFELLGIPFDERGARTDEAVDAIAAALEDEWASAEFGQQPRPVRRPRPPIWIGGSSKAALRRAAARGDGWLPQGTLKADMPDAIAFIRAEREKAGRGDDPIDIGTISPFLYVGDPEWDTGKGVLKGAPDKIAGYLRDFADMGVGQVQVRFRSRDAGELCDQIRAFGTDVAPLLDK